MGWGGVGWGGVGWGGVGWGGVGVGVGWWEWRFEVGWGSDRVMRQRQCAVLPHCGSFCTHLLAGFPSCFCACCVCTTRRSTEAGPRDVWFALLPLLAPALLHKVASTQAVSDVLSRAVALLQLGEGCPRGVRLLTPQAVLAVLVGCASCRVWGGVRAGR